MPSVQPAPSRLTEKTPLSARRPRPTARPPPGCSPARVACVLRRTPWPCRGRSWGRTSGTASTWRTGTRLRLYAARACHRFVPCALAPSHEVPGPRRHREPGYCVGSLGRGRRNELRGSRPAPAGGRRASFRGLRLPVEPPDGPLHVHGPRRLAGKVATLGARSFDLGRVNPHNTRVPGVCAARGHRGKALGRPVRTGLFSEGRASREGHSHLHHRPTPQVELHVAGWSL